MASIIKKTIKNHTYYYYVESKRIDGKPKPVNQKYLGTAEAILAKILNAGQPIDGIAQYSDVADFGAVMLIFDIAARLGITDIIDETIPKRKQEASVGTYILTAAINRATKPSSKNELAKWYSGTCLPMAMGFKPSVFTPQNFWNNTCISAEQVEQIDEAIVKKVIDAYKIDTTHIIYDATNFFTFIDTMNESKLAKRGHCKQKRNDLRIVGLSLMVSPDYSIPLLHDTYPGNDGDAKEFKVMIERLKKRYEAITNTKTDATVIFDRGNNSEVNIEMLESGNCKLHYVGGLKKNQATELYDIARSEYIPLNSPSLEGNSAYRKEMKIFGRDMTVVIVHNPELEKGQMQGILINKDKTETALRSLKDQLSRWESGEVSKGKKPTTASVESAVKKILSVEYMDDIFSYDIYEYGGKVGLFYHCSEQKLDQICDKYLGKTVLFTDRKDFTNEQIVSSYRSAWHVEAAFKQMKNTNHLTVRPILHWTDEKIKVHIFTCVLAYRLCSLLIKELASNGINISINRLMDSMSCIKRVYTFFGNIDKPQKVKTYTVGSELENSIEAIYQLKEKYS